MEDLKNLKSKLKGYIVSGTDGEQYFYLKGLKFVIKYSVKENF